MAKLTKYLPLLLGCIGIYWVLRPLWGNVWYPMHDSTHVTRLYLMEQTIRNGQFPPIWAEGVNNGYGYPLFHFYAPLFYYVALAIKTFGISYIVALKAALLLFIGIGTTGVYTFAKRWGKSAAVVAATAFVTAPYLAVNLYVRGAFAEIAAISLLPWVMVGWEHITTRRGQITAAAITALFLMSHNLIPLAAFPFIAAWVLIINRQQLSKVGVPVVLTGALAAGYLLPLLFERSLTQADNIARTTNYAVHFVYPWQLWNSTWGFGGSALGGEDGMSFKMGKVQLILALGGVVYLAAKRQKRGLLIGLAALAALFLATTLARPVWESIPMLSIIQFPWRYLGIAAVFLACMSGAAIAAIPGKILRVCASIGILIALLFFNLKLFQPSTTFVADDTQFTRPAYVSTISQIIPEFMPKWMKGTPQKPAATSLERAYYPTWKATIDGKPIPYHPDSNGVIAFDESIDSSRIVLTQSHTPLERMGYVITILAIGFVIYLWRRQ